MGENLSPVSDRRQRRRRQSRRSNLVEVTLRGVSSVMGAIGTDFVKSTFNLIKVAAARDDGERHDDDAVSFFFSVRSIN